MGRAGQHMQRLAQVRLPVPFRNGIPHGPAVNRQKNGRVVCRRLELDGARPDRLLTEGFGYAGHVENGVQKNFSFDRTRQGVRIIDPVFAVRVVRLARKLVGPGAGDRPEQMLQIITVLAEIASQGFE